MLLALDVVASMHQQLLFIEPIITAAGLLTFPEKSLPIPSEVRNTWSVISESLLSCKRLMTTAPKARS